MQKETRSDKIGAFYIWLDHNKDFYENNLAYLDSLGIPPRRRIYVSRLAPTVIALLNEEQQKKAKNISRYPFEVPEKMSEEITLGQIKADAVKGTNSPEYSLFGEGVSLGVISAENLTFDPLAESLSKKTVTSFPSIIPPKIDTHPTVVLSTAAGNEAEADGVEFFGVARDANILFAPTYSSKNVYDAIERMVEMGVRVINYSAGIYHDGMRYDFDRQIDRLILNGDFLFVVAAGNYERLASPGKAYNALTVGNAATKSAPTIPLPSPYAMGDGSAFLTSPQKPEISAPGEYVGFVDRNGNADFENFGTSFATPFVSGVALQLLSLKKDISYLTLKGIILASADGGAISPDDNPEVAPFVRAKSGYGLVDALQAVKLLTSADVTEGRLDGVIEKEVTGNGLFFIFELGEEKSYPRLFVDGEEVEVEPQTSILIKRRVERVLIEGEGGRRFSLIVL